MKKVLFVLSMLLCLLLLSCSSDQENQIQDSKNYSQCDDAHYVLKKMNEKNPYSSVGVRHNLIVSNMINDLKMVPSRSNDSIIEYTAQIRQAALLRIDSVLLENSAPDSCYNPLVQVYDSIIPAITVKTPEEIHVVEPRDLLRLSNNAQRLVTSIEEAIKDTTLTSTAKLNMLDELYDLAETTLDGDEYEQVAIILSVASNSTVFWMEDVPSIIGEHRGNVLTGVVDDAVSYDVATVMVYIKSKAWLLTPPGLQLEVLTTMSASASAVAGIARGISNVLGWIGSLF